MRAILSHLFPQKKCIKLIITSLNIVVVREEDGETVDLLHQPGLV